MSIVFRSGLLAAVLLGMTITAQAQLVKNASDCPGGTKAVMQCGGADNRASCWYRCVANPTTPGADGCAHGVAVPPKGGYKKKVSSNPSAACHG